MQYNPPRSKDYAIKPLCYLLRFLFSLFTLIGCTSRKIAGLQHYIILEFHFTIIMLSENFAQLFYCVKQLDVIEIGKVKDGLILCFLSYIHGDCRDKISSRI